MQRAEGWHVQVELFTAYGHYQPAGAVRVTWLQVGAQDGRMGLGTGDAGGDTLCLVDQARSLKARRAAIPCTCFVHGASASGFWVRLQLSLMKPMAEGLMDCAIGCEQVRCQAPAKLALQQAPQQAVRLQAAHSGRAAGTAAVQVSHCCTTPVPYSLHLPWRQPDHCVLYHKVLRLCTCKGGRCWSPCRSTPSLLRACGLQHLAPSHACKTCTGAHWQPGNTSLAVSFGLERRNDSVLAPTQWLDPASGYQKLFMGLQGSCCDGQVQI